MSQHWTAEEHPKYRDEDHMSGHIIRYDPTPGGRKNADGTTTHSCNFPAIVITQWVGDPAKAAQDIADALNSADAKDKRIAELEAQLAAMDARKDGAYEERNRVVAALAKVFPSGTCRTNIPGWSDDWHGCVRIDLPTGQVSWHFHDSHAHLFADLPAYAGEWDGHDTPEKYRRLATLALASAKATNDVLDQARKVIGDDDAEKAAKWHDRQAQSAMGSLHCGSENWEYREAHRVCDLHRFAARAIRLAAALASHPAQAGEA